jgi:hypothetical protein
VPSLSRATESSQTPFLAWSKCRRKKAKNRNHLWFQVVSPVYIALPLRCGREISLGLSIRGSAGANHSDEYPVFGQKVPLDDFQHPGAIRFVAFGEIDLNFISTFRKTPADLLFMLGRANEQIPDEFLPTTGA